jgi:tripartite-type tricarboxylate transporter receptor subunit TctC
MKRTKLALALALTALANAGTATAQEWPARPVTLVVPYAAGGPVDTIARILTARMSEILGQQIIVENAGGAGGMTGTARVAKAAPDGYTLLLSGSATLAQVPNLYKKPLYNPFTDFEHVVMHSDSARILITRPDFPAGTLAEFVAYAKANQARMQFGSAGAGSGLHICAVLLNGAMGTSITHVPYRGSALAMQDLIAGRIDFMAEQISTAASTSSRPPTSRASRASTAAPGARSRSRRARPTRSCAASPRPPTTPSNRPPCASGSRRSG